LEIENPKTTKNGIVSRKKSAIENFFEEIERDYSRSEAPSRLKCLHSRNKGGRNTPSVSFPSIKDDKISLFVSNTRNSCMGMICENKQRNENIFADFETCI